MARQLPKSLKGFTVFVDGRGYAGRLNSGKLPPIKMKTEDFRDGGMDTEVALEVGMEKMEAELVFAELEPLLLGLVGTRDVPITLRGSQEDERGQTQAVIAELRGLVTESDNGEWKAGEGKTEAKLMVSPDYYRLRIGGVEVYEIDAVNAVRRIGGIDQLATRRQNLGL